MQGGHPWAQWKLGTDTSPPPRLRSSGRDHMAEIHAPCTKSNLHNYTSVCTKYCTKVMTAPHSCTKLRPHCTKVTTEVLSCTKVVISCTKVLGRIAPKLAPKLAHKNAPEVSFPFAAQCRPPLHQSSHQSLRPSVDLFGPKW